MHKFFLYCIHLYIVFVYKTSKIFYTGCINKIQDVVEKKEKGVVIFTWHGKISISPIMIRKIFKKNIKRFYVLASAHKDGQTIAKVISYFGINIIEGSSINLKKIDKSTNSISAIRQIIQNLNNKNVILLSPDGPRGPAFKMNTKIVDIVQKTLSVIIPVAISYKYKIQLNTWDFFQIPLPFNKIVFDCIDMFQPNKETNIEELKKELENVMIEHTHQADMYINNKK